MSTPEQYVAVERPDGWHIADQINGWVSGLIPEGQEMAEQGARNLAQARIDCFHASLPVVA